MRILIVAPSAYILGGVQNWLDYLLPGLNLRGHEVVLGLVDGDIHRAGRYLNSHPWFHVERICNLTGSAKGRANSISKKILKIQPNIVISVNIGDCMEAVASLRASGADGFRLIMTVHGIEADYIYDLAHYSSVIDGVVFTNRLIERLVLAKAEIDRSRLFYAPYGVDIDKIRDVVDKDSRSILWMGRFDQTQKRCLELPLIAQELDSTVDSWKLVLAGDGPDAKALYAGLAEYIGSKVTWLGYLPHQQLLTEVLPKADALLVNSTWETGPITIWEAMAAGVPVVTSKYIGSGAEGSLKHKHNALMFEVGDVSGAVNCLNQLFNDLEMRRTIVKNGRELVEQHYSISQSVDRWHGAIERVMELAPREKVGTEFLDSRAHGRLDQWFGSDTGENIRKIFGKKWKHDTAGGEWPHARFGASPEERDKFLHFASTLDLPGHGLPTVESDEQ